MPLQVDDLSQNNIFYNVFSGFGVQSAWLKSKRQEAAARPSLQQQDQASSPREPRALLQQLLPLPPQQSRRQPQSHQQLDLAKGEAHRKQRRPLCHRQSIPPLEVDSSEDEAAEEEEEPKVNDMVVDPDHDVSKERERSVSASATTRLPLSSRTGVRLELRSNQETKQNTPRRTWRGSRTAASSKPEEASGSLKRPHSSGGGSAKKRGQSVAFKEGHRRWDRMVAKRELEEVDEAAELWNYLRGKPSKIDFSDLSDG